MNLADKMLIQHLNPIVSQEFKVRIYITCIYERVLLIHVDTCSITPSPTQPVLQTTTLTPLPHIQPWACFLPKNYSDLMDILLFLTFLFGIFISSVFFAILKFTL